MGESDEQLRDRMRQAVAQGGAAGAFQVLAEMGAAVEKEPEAGVGIRIRFGAGTDDGFTMTHYAAASDRPAGWPVEVPFLPDTAAALTLFEGPGRGFSVQWWKVTNRATAVAFILAECTAAGWHARAASEPQVTPPLAGMRTVEFQRDDRVRVVTSATAKDVGIVLLVERRQGESCSVSPGPRAAS